MPARKRLIFLFFNVMVKIFVNHLAEKKTTTFYELLGNSDPLVRLHWGRLSEERIKSLGFKQNIFKEYDGMTHTTSSEVQ